MAMTERTDRTDRSDRTIEREVVIDAPAEVVWRTITEPDQIALWFADRVQVDLRPGGEGTLVFQGRATGDEVTAAIAVAAVEPPHRFAFRWGHAVGEVADAGNSVLVEFTLHAEGAERTRLRVAETGLAGLGWSDDRQQAYVDDHLEGWQIHCDRLVALFATRAG